MNNNRPGFLTPPNLIAAILTVLIVAGAALAQGGILFSPGALSARSGVPLGGVTSHAAIGGQCSLCHVPFWSSSTMTDRCVACHTDVTTQWANQSSLHGILHQEYPAAGCRSCHPDHLGPNAPVTIMNLDTFPHDSVGYSLTAHKVNADGAPIVCSDCHVQGYTHFDQSVCTICHTQINPTFMQVHTRDFGTTCRICHDGVDTYGRNFNHNIVSYQLIGNHTQVPCGQCHLNARSIADLKSTPQDCNSCHAAQDAHQGRLGTDCGSCHNPAGWTPAKFDHNLSTFKLTGKHVNVACTSCHFNNIYHGSPTDCYTCHEKSDPHNGQFGTKDCGTCHTPSGWTPSTYNHNLASFKLTGKHVNVPCTSCHVNSLFKGTPTGCNSCHQKDDPHNGQFGSTSCSTCHTTSGWSPASFDHSLFPLTNGHAGLACTQCHTGGVYRGLASACAACHAEPAVHAGQFGTDCAQCHNTSNWNATFNHPDSCGEGGCVNHHRAGCADCHTVNYSTATCTKCHDSNNPHGDG